jgi:hypothetical protein
MLMQAMMRLNTDHFWLAYFRPLISTHMVKQVLLN